MKTGAHELSKLIKQRYVPTSLERKRAIMMYLFVGIIIGLETKQISLYEMFHLKQSLGWWTLFFMFMVLFLFAFFLPFFVVRIVPVIIFLIMLGVLSVFVRQAWNGVYLTGKNEDKLFMPIFSGVGGWILSMFDVYHDDVIDLEDEDILDEDDQNLETVEKNDMSDEGQSQKD